MTFIEVHLNEDHSALEKLVRGAYSSIGFPEELPSFRFGRVIVWQGRMFQQLEVSIEFEDRLFRLWTLPADKARVQVGSIRGEVFITPPELAGEPAARIKEGGRCGREYVVRPFHYSDYDRDAS
jgi:hypothetical protein